MSGALSAPQPVHAWARTLTVTFFDPDSGSSGSPPDLTLVLVVILGIAIVGTGIGSAIGRRGARRGATPPRA